MVEEVKAGTRTVDELFQLLLNTQFIMWLDAEMFSDQLSRIYSEELCPDYDKLPQVLLRYPTTKENVNDLRKDDGAVLVMGRSAKSNDRLTSKHIFGCCGFKGKHLREECPYKVRKCNVCGQKGHLRKMCPRALSHRSLTSESQDTLNRTIGLQLPCVWAHL
jgi:hypothetical protein